MGNWKKIINKSAITDDIKPTLEIKIDDCVFSISDVYINNESGRDIIFLWSQVERNNFIIKILYRSQSDGCWRAATPDTLNPFGKGSVHYVQETKVHSKLTNILDLQSINDSTISNVHKNFTIFKYNSFSDKSEESNRIFSLFAIMCNKYDTETLDSIDTHINFPKIYLECMPGMCFKINTLLKKYNCKNYTEYIENFINPELRKSSFLQMFNMRRNIVSEYNISHTILSEKIEDGIYANDIIIRVYESKLNDRIIEWHMAVDKSENHVWIERIRFKDTKINYCGVDSEFINSGILTNKPIEYTEQSTELIDSTERIIIPGHEKYSYITPLLANLYPIDVFCRTFRYGKYKLK